MAVLAAWAAGVMLLAPSLRWFFRRRINKVIAQINTRLAVDLPSFKLTRRQVLIDRLFHDAKVQAAVALRAHGDRGGGDAGGVPRRGAHHRGQVARTAPFGGVEMALRRAIAGSPQIYWMRRPAVTFGLQAA
jgi:hypothetical protein